MTPDKCNSLHNHAGQYGNIDVLLEWSNALAEPIYCLYELVFPKKITNNKREGYVTVSDVE